jgi:hypothetical protein
MGTLCTRSGQHQTYPAHRVHFVAMTTQPDLRTIGGRLQWARENFVAPYGERLSSPRAAARFFGWNENTYKSHENGLRGDQGLKVKTAEKYAKGYKISLAWLMTGQGSPFERPAVAAPSVAQKVRA